MLTSVALAEMASRSYHHRQAALEKEASDGIPKRESEEGLARERRQEVPNVVAAVPR
jgi:hypothetical protein